MKKRKGDITDVFLGLLIILCIGIVVVVVLNIVEMAVIKADAEGYARSCLLQMETEGYLTQGAAETLKQELTAIGLENIDLTNTTMSQVGYGQAIYLNIRYDMPLQQLNTSSGGVLDYFFEDVSKPDVIRLKSTAKH